MLHPTVRASSLLMRRLLGAGLALSLVACGGRTARRDAEPSAARGGTAGDGDSGSLAGAGRGGITTAGAAGEGPGAGGSGSALTRQEACSLASEAYAAMGDRCDCNSHPDCSAETYRGECCETASEYSVEEHLACRDHWQRLGCLFYRRGTYEVLWEHCLQECGVSAAGPLGAAAELCGAVAEAWAEAQLRCACAPDDRLCAINEAYWYTLHGPGCGDGRALSFDQLTACRDHWRGIGCEALTAEVLAAVDPCVPPPYLGSWELAP